MVPLLGSVSDDGMFAGVVAGRVGRRRCRCEWGYNRRTRGGWMCVLQVGDGGFLFVSGWTESQAFLEYWSGAASGDGSVIFERL